LHGLVLDTADIYEMLAAKGIKPDLEIREPDAKEFVDGPPQKAREPVPAMAPPVIMELKTNAVPVEPVIEACEQEEDEE
jgi:hypothetical protein